MHGLLSGDADYIRALHGRDRQVLRLDQDAPGPEGPRRLRGRPAAGRGHRRRHADPGRLERRLELQGAVRGGAAAEADRPPARRRVRARRRATTGPPSCRALRDKCRHDAGLEGRARPAPRARADRAVGRRARRDPPRLLPGRRAAVPRVRRAPGRRRPAHARRPRCGSARGRSAATTGTTPTAGRCPCSDHEMSSCEPCYSWNVFHSWQLGDREKFLEGMYSLFAGALSRKTFISCETRGGITGNVFAGAAGRLPGAPGRGRRPDRARASCTSCASCRWPGSSPATRRRFESLPTEFGPVTLATRVSRDGRTLALASRPAFRGATAAAVILHVPPIPGLRSVRVNGRRRPAGELSRAIKSIWITHDIPKEER